MKTLVAILLFLITTGNSFAQNKKYLKAMESNIAAIFQADSAADFDPIANKFERISQAESDQWEPLYYVALTHTFKAFRIKNPAEKDAVLDQALEAIKKAGEISARNAEILAMEGFINMIKIGVDPATRGRTLSPKIMANFSQALQIDPNNPRVNLFMGQMLYGSAQFFGSGVEEPCAMVNKSIALFETEEPASTIAPSWGEKSAMQYQEQCKVALTAVSTK